MLDHGATGVLRIGPDGERRQDELQRLRAVVRARAADARVRRDRLRRRGGPGREVPRLSRHGLRRPRRVRDPKRFPEADEVVVEWPHRFLEKAEVDARTVICVLTHDPKFDVPLLEAALKTDAAYIGAMGSRRTHEDRLARLRDEGVSEESLARIASPIGLDIGARTPEETAVSIAAEIVALRWGGSGQRLAGTDGPIHR